jgi:hypothetical protein
MYTLGTGHNLHVFVLFKITNRGVLHGGDKKTKPNADLELGKGREIRAVVSS